MDGGMLGMRHSRTIDFARDFGHESFFSEQGQTGVSSHRFTILPLYYIYNRQKHVIPHRENQTRALGSGLTIDPFQFVSFILVCVIQPFTLT